MIQNVEVTHNDLGVLRNWVFFRWSWQEGPTLKLIDFGEAKMGAEGRVRVR